MRGGWRKKIFSGADLMSALPPHPGPLPWGEGVPLSHSRNVHKSVTQSHVSAIYSRLDSVFHRWVIQFILLATLLVARNAFAADKLEADLIPLGLRARNSAPIPVEARFKWDGTRVLEGRLELEFHEGERVLGRFRTDDLALTTGEQRFRLLLPPLVQPYSDSQVEVRMKFVNSEETLNLDSSSLFLPTMRERAMSLGWCNARADSAPHSADLEQSMLLERFSPQLSPSEQRQLSTSMIRVNPEDLPIQPLAYTAFDVMVLTADGFSEAHEGQLQTLARWVKGGGSVCVFVGDGLQSHHLAFLNELIDTNSTGPVFMADSRGNLLPGMKKISCLHSGVGRSVIVTGNIQSDSGLDSPTWREAVAFLWKVRHSQEQAILETGHWEIPTNAFNWEASFPNQPYSGYGYRGGRRPSGAIPAQATEYGVQHTSFGAELTTQLIPRTVRLIPFPALLGTLGVFVLMIGPVDYLFLGWLRRRRYTWVLFPALSIVFTVGTVLMANHYLGLRDQRRSLLVVDIDKDGTPLRWNRYELVFAARNKQAVTELKDALWASLESDGLAELNPMAPYPASYNNNMRYRRGGGLQPDSGPPWYEGTLPAHFQTRKDLRQWRPELNRVFSFEPPPVPTLANWSAVEEAWPNLQAIRAKLSANKSFVGDVCVISTSTPTAALPANNVAETGDGSADVDEDRGVVGPSYRVSFDGASPRILPGSILAKLCLGDSITGLRYIVSQISPTGGGNFEDIQVMDTNELALAIVTREGDDIVVYRRIFHAD